MTMRSGLKNLMDTLLRVVESGSDGLHSIVIRLRSHLSKRTDQELSGIDANLAKTTFNVERSKLITQPQSLTFTTGGTGTGTNTGIVWDCVAQCPCKLCAKAVTERRQKLKTPRGKNGKRRKLPRD